MLWIGIIASVYIIYSGIAHEPLIDFRDYKIGVDMNAERQKIAANPSEYKTSYTLKNSKTGEEKVVNQDDYVNKEEYWKEGTSWQIQTGKEVSVLTKQGYKSAIDKFKLEDENKNDLTEQILHLPKVYLFFSYNPDKMDVYDRNTIEHLEALTLDGSKIYGVSTKHNVFPSIENLTMDGTAIKTIARSNPLFWF